MTTREQKIRVLQDAAELSDVDEFTKVLRENKEMINEQDFTSNMFTPLLLCS
jgi:hypothetical protein